MVLSDSKNNVKYVAYPITASAKIACVDPNVPRLTHPLHVQVVWLVAVAGVLFKYALAEDRKRRDLFRKYPVDTARVRKELSAANIMRTPGLRYRTKSS